MHNEEIGFIIVGLVMGLLFVAIPLGLVVYIIRKYSGFGASDEEPRRRHQRPNLRNRRQTRGRIHVDEYGHIFDPHDEEF